MRRKAIIFDGDGVLHIQGEVVKEAIELVKELRKEWDVFYVTNNSNQCDKDAFEMLGGAIERRKIITPCELVERFVEKRGYKTFYPICSKKIEKKLLEKGLEIKEGGEFVIASFTREVSYEKIRKASLSIIKGAEFVATNTDRFFPTKDGMAPGAGWVVGALSFVTQKSPFILGKPSKFLVELFKSFNYEDYIVVGDNYETDIKFGKELGAKTILFTKFTKPNKKVREVRALIVNEYEELKKVIKKMEE